jgi:carbonic anhydrase/acetyltransferase-like protein (isoleucine patch superfamily)
MILPYREKTPILHPTVFVAPTAVIIGDVEIAEGASVWFGAVLRGDMAPIRIGARTNIQDNCTLHVDADTPATIGAGVTIGHNAVVHGCTIEDDCLIGMGALVLNRAKIGNGTIIAAGAVVREDQVVPAGQLAAGTPAAVKKPLSVAAAATIREAAAHYCQLAGEYGDSEV